MNKTITTGIGLELQGPTMRVRTDLELGFARGQEQK